MRVRKAVIPAAGFGTRFLPVTKSVPKSMLPIIATPVIQYVVEEAVASGIEQIIMVAGENRGPLEAYFDRSPALETRLRETGKQAMLDEVIRIADLANIAYVTQKEPLGNGHAVLMARYVVGDEPFVVLWGDDILIGRPPVAQQLIAVAEHYDAPVVGVRRVPASDFEKYGMVQVEGMSERVGRAVSVVEKPRRDESPSDLAQIGGFVLTPDVFDILADTAVGPTGEIFLADALITLMQRRTVYAYEFSGQRYDAGNKLDFLRATVDMALADPELAPGFREFLGEVAEREGVPR